MEKNWLFLTWQWNTSIDAEPRLSIALCFHNKSDTKSNTFRLAFFTMISIIIIIIISVITGFALQYQFLEEVGSIGVSLWGQRVGWWWSWLTAPDRAQAPVSVAERCSGRSVCRLARIFRNLAIYNFVEFAFKQMLAKKKVPACFYDNRHNETMLTVTWRWLSPDYCDYFFLEQFIKFSLATTLNYLICLSRQKWYQWSLRDVYDLQEPQKDYSMVTMETILYWLF